MKFLLFLWLVLFSTFINANASGNILVVLNKTTATIISSVSDKEEELEEDFAPGLFLFAISAFIFILFCIGAGIVVTSLTLLMLFGFITAGILSASIMVGFNKRSLTSGFKTLILFTGTIFGTILGVLFFIVLQKVCHWWTMQESLLMGGFSGLLGGYLLSILLLYMIRKFSGFLKNKIAFKI